MARGLEIPAVVGLGPFLYRLRGGSTIISRRYRGKVIVNPDEKVLVQYQERREDRQSRAANWSPIATCPQVTRCGCDVQLLANIEFPHEVQACLSRGATGVGLYRTEFLYLGSANEPSEEEHYQAYSPSSRQCNGKPVVIRTLDLGADKMGHKRWRNKNKPVPGTAEYSLVPAQPGPVPHSARRLYERQRAGICRSCFDDYHAARTAHSSHGLASSRRRFVRRRYRGFPSMSQWA